MSTMAMSPTPTHIPEMLGSTKETSKFINSFQGNSFNKISDWYELNPHYKQHRVKICGVQ